MFEDKDMEKTGPYILARVKGTTLEILKRNVCCPFHAGIQVGGFMAKEHEEEGEPVHGYIIYAHVADQRQTIVMTEFRDTIPLEDLERIIQLHFIGEIFQDFTPLLLFGDSEEPAAPEAEDTTSLLGFGADDLSSLLTRLQQDMQGGSLD